MKADAVLLIFLYFEQNGGILNFMAIRFTSVYRLFNINAKSVKMIDILNTIFYIDFGLTGHSRKNI